jgi:hypothetical protein
VYDDAHDSDRSRDRATLIRAEPVAPEWTVRPGAAIAFRRSFSE